VADSPDALPDPARACDPRHVDISLSQGVTITWGDGHVSHYAIKALREACRCATCQGTHGPADPAPAAPAVLGALPMFKPTGGTLLAAEPVGRYALQFHFSDGHNTGIYTWTYLRELCPCAPCAALRPPEK